jgi:hypothetical protein
MFDQLWDESPMVKKMKKQSFDEGEAKGEVKGEVQGVRRSLVKYVQRKFPELTELAQAKSTLLHDFDALEVLYEQIQDATSAQTVQQLLVSIAEPRD